MTQTATVTALSASGGALCPGTVEVTVSRQTACGHDCGGCGRCAGRARQVAVRAVSDIPVDVGDRVEIYSGGRVLGIAALVYVLPVALFLLGYLLPAFLPEGGRYACGALGFLLGLAAAVLYDRRAGRERPLTYRVIRKL